jgi:hypothetical protein
MFLSPRTLVSTLFYSCSPSTIAWLIVAINIRIPIQAKVFTPTATHIHQKVFEAINWIKPTITHSNATATVIFIGHMSRVIASHLHHRPGVVFQLVKSGQAFMLTATMLLGILAGEVICG